MNNPIIVLECKTPLPQLPEEYNDCKLLFTFYLYNGICYTGTSGSNIGNRYSSRNIKIYNNNTISFSKRNSELQEQKIILNSDVVKIIATYTPFVSFKHYSYLSKILNEFTKTNKNKILNKNILTINDSEPKIEENVQHNNAQQNITQTNESKKIEKFIQNNPKNISTDLEGSSVSEALQIIKNMEQNDKIRYLLLFVIYFFPLDVLDNSISRSIKSLYSYTTNVKDYLKKILLSYIIHIYPNNKELANKNSTLLYTYFYNEELFKIYEKSINHISELKSKYINVNYDSDCELRKFYSQKNNCTINNYNFSGSITTTYDPKIHSINENMYHLLNYVKGKKGNSTREIIVHIEHTNNVKKNHNESTITIREKNIDYIFPYILIEKIAEKSTYLSFHQLLTINYIYNDLKFSNLKYNNENNKKNELFDYLIAVIIYLYGNRDFKDKIRRSKDLSTIELYNLPTKNRLNQINKSKKEEIINKVIKMYIYLHKQKSCNKKTFLATQTINNIIEIYNNFMKISNSTNTQLISTILNSFMHITSCSENPEQSINILKQNVCLPITPCKLERKSILSNIGQRVKRLVPKIYFN